MLKKLLKYDIKGTAKSLIPFYGIVLLLSILVRLSGIVKDHFPVTGFINAMMLIFFVISVIAIIFYTFFIAMKRFYRTVLKDEGYLTHTLPVKRSNIVLSQTISSLVFFFISVIVMIISLLIAFYSKSGLKLVFDTINNMFMLMETSPWIGYTYFIVSMITGYISYILLFYLSLILGHQKNSNKIIYSIVYGLIIYSVLQVLSLISLGVAIIFDPNLINVMNDEMATFKDMASLFISSGVFSLLIPIASYFLSCKFINTKLNLE